MPRNTGVYGTHQAQGTQGGGATTGGGGGGKWEEAADELNVADDADEA